MRSPNALRLPTGIDEINFTDWANGQTPPHTHTHAQAHALDLVFFFITISHLLAVDEERKLAILSAALTNRASSIRKTACSLIASTGNVANSFWIRRLLRIITRDPDGGVRISAIRGMCVGDKQRLPVREEVVDRGDKVPFKLGKCSVCQMLCCYSYFIVFCWSLLPIYFRTRALIILDKTNYFVLQTGWSELT